MTEIRFANTVSAAIRGAEIVAVLAPQKALADGWHKTAIGQDWASALDRAIEDTKPGDSGSAGSTYGPTGAPRKLVACVLPDSVSRHNSPTRSESILSTFASVGASGKKSAAIVYLDDAAHALAAGVAIARALPLFSAKSGKSGNGRVRIVFVLADGSVVRADKVVKETVDAVRLSARLVDTHPEVMTTAQVEREARKACRGVKGVRVTAITGKAKLEAAGLGGILGVGRAAVVPPRLVIMDYKPAKSTRTIALVGKGIVYDTGGLNIKVGGGMSNMKMDMGGAAAVVGAFVALAKSGCKDRVVALLCLAENAVGPHSYRPDDILTMHSGKTVEINNTDAEGRLVLADGVSWAARKIKADLVIDIATLTGAALISTGRNVSCSISNREGLERLSVTCGRATGDLTHPLLFAPEFFHGEFPSKVADMRNSVKDRMNAQSSAAAQFVYNHIEDTGVPWLHVDIAGPAFRGLRGTGHGVGLLSELVRRVTDEDLAS